jgi:hypothetical protein
MSLMPLMALDGPPGPIRTTHLELVALTAPFADAVVAGERATAAAEIAAGVGSWLISDSSHVVQVGRPRPWASTVSAGPSCSGGSRRAG